MMRPQCRKIETNLFMLFFFALIILNEYKRWRRAWINGLGRRSHLPMFWESKKERNCGFHKSVTFKGNSIYGTDQPVWYLRRDNEVFISATKDCCESPGHLPPPETFLPILHHQGHCDRHTHSWWRGRARADGLLSGSPPVNGSEDKLSRGVLLRGRKERRKKWRYEKTSLF